MYFFNGVAPSGSLQIVQPRNAAAGRRGESELNTVLPGTVFQFFEVSADQCFVGGNHVFSVLHGSQHVFQCRMDATDTFCYQIDIRIVQNIVDIFCLQVRIFRLRPANQDASHFQVDGRFHRFTGTAPHGSQT